MDKLIALIIDQGLGFGYERGTWRVYKVGGTEAKAPTLEEAAKMYFGNLVDKRVDLAVPLEEYAKSPDADPVVIKAFRDGTKVPLPVAVEDPFGELPVDVKLP